MSLYGYIFGFVKFSVRIKNKEKLLDLLRKSFAIKSAVCDEDKLNFLCFYRDEYRVRETVAKAGGEILAAKKYGLMYILDKYKKRYGLIAGFVICLILIYLHTLFVWYIDIEGNEKVSEIQVKRVLKESGFHEGILKKNANIDSIVNRYLIKEDRVSFIAINFDGVIARVQIKEADIPKGQKLRENVNIVAKCDGVIMRVDALKGKSEVSKGDVVTKGQLLISSVMKGRGGSEYITGAGGFVFATTEKNIDIHVPLSYYEKRIYERKFDRFEIEILGRKLSFSGLGRSKDGLYNCEKMKIEPSFEENYTFPFDLYLQNR